MNTLFAISGVSGGDVWAVGRSADDDAVSTPLIEHWDGTRWSVVPSPEVEPVGEQTTLISVSANATDDVWAVGWAGPRSHTAALTEHWDGVAWSVVPPALTTYELNAVDAVSAHDVWAVGDFQTEHCNGHRWRLVDDSHHDFLFGIDHVDADDVWAVGTPNYSSTRVRHWDGSDWSDVDSPSGYGNRSRFEDVAAQSRNDAWAVGLKLLHGRGSALMSHWDGSAWVKVRPPGGAKTGDALTSVDGVASDDVWAVGGSRHSGLLEHWDGQTWSRQCLRRC